MIPQQSFTVIYSCAGTARCGTLSSPVSSPPSAQRPPNFPWNARTHVVEAMIGVVCEGRVCVVLQVKCRSTDAACVRWVLCCSCLDSRLRGERSPLITFELREKRRLPRCELNWAAPRAGGKWHVHAIKQHRRDVEGPTAVQGHTVCVCGQHDAEMQLGRVREGKEEGRGVLQSKHSVLLCVGLRMHGQTELSLQSFRDTR